MEKQLILALIALWAVFSFTSCAAQRPNSDVCIVNAPNKNRKCYNLATQYDENGALKPGAVATYRANATIVDLNKALVIDSPTGFEDGLAALKIYIKELRDHYANCQVGN